LGYKLPKLAYKTQIIGNPELLVQDHLKEKIRLIPISRYKKLSAVLFTNPDPETNPDPDPIRIQGFNDQKLGKNYS
jgi:hypothetical protein